ncbi:MAG: TRAM domain-containing protein, partial [Oscillospiraceae bacterium]|nr:TRAM domain-containing protein [Oscillospiraceae bacterium]
MSVKKNQCIPLLIESLSSEGSGVGRFEGQAIFVPGTAPGDRLTARIVKDCKRYAYGIVERMEAPSPDHRAEDCP